MLNLPALEKKFPAKNLLWVLLIAALGHSLWTLSFGWSHGILDEHLFRQTQTALVAFFLAKGGPFFSYEMPLLGPPWSLPFELPVYQWLVAKISLLTGLPLEQSGRAVGRFFFMALLWPLADIFRQIGLKKESILAGLILYLLSPLYLFWSRTFLIESTALFFAVAYFSLALRALHGAPSPSLLFFTALAGSLAGTVKITTAFSFFFFAAIFASVSLWRTRKFFWQTKASWALRFFCVFLLPSIASLHWIHHSDLLKQANPLAEFLLSKNLNQWNFGTWAQRISSDTWYMFFRKTFHDSIGHRTTWLLSLALLPFISKRHLFMSLAAFLGFFLAPMVFTNLHIAHNYYWYANGIFLLVYLTIVLDGLWQRIGAFHLVFYVFFVLAAGLSLRHYYKFPYHWQMVNNNGFSDLEAPLSKMLKDSDVAVVLGADWLPAVAWGAKKPVIMIREGSLLSPALARSLNLLKQEGRSVGVVINCGAPEKDMEALKPLVPFLPTKRYQGSCSIYESMPAL